ncbi:transposable element Tcb1 transposase [Trichonephila clavipes]|nr:transposable element Tcb1 transposase [Trichonephila clavipes]
MLNITLLGELWFQQDGARCHTARATIDLLKDSFGDRLISRFGPVNWPPRSCDLTLVNYFLWGYVKSLVYADKPQTLHHLEDNIRRVIADIRPQMLEKVIENWTSRFDYIRGIRGSHMPDVIFKIVIGRLECRRTQLEVSEELGITQIVISRLWQRFQDDGTAKRNRRSTASDLSRQLSSATGTTVSKQTVYRRLGHIGLYARRPVRCVPLTATHCCLRLTWSTEHALWTPQQWSCVMFSIESSSRTDLHVQSVTRTGHMYRDVILEQPVRLFWGTMGAEFLFMDGNVDPHRANIVDKCLQSEDITRMDWPAYSQD